MRFHFAVIGPLLTASVGSVRDAFQFTVADVIRSRTRSVAQRPDDVATAIISIECRFRDSISSFRSTNAAAGVCVTVLALWIPQQAVPFVSVFLFGASGPASVTPHPTTGSVILLAIAARFFAGYVRFT
jgi:hypothetical protein